AGPLDPSLRRPLPRLPARTDRPRTLLPAPRPGRRTASGTVRRAAARAGGGRRGRRQRPLSLEEFRRHGAQAHLFEPDTAELHSRGHPPAGAVLADGYLLPLADGVADIAFSSNVLEHVADPYTFLSELARVTRPGGLIYVSYTNWLSPWGGHEWAPWHYLGAERARARYRRRTGRAAKHTLGDNLFPLHIGPVLRHVRSRADVTVVSARSRYWPFLTEAVTRVPGLREVATWNLLLILRRSP
ncbi:LOW QUALITY PROTEIN: putative methyltransferase (Methylase) putative signal peptide, partial [Streptomyces himastatinicus ATCC 53653]